MDWLMVKFLIRGISSYTTNCPSISTFHILREPWINSPAVIRGWATDTAGLAGLAGEVGIHGSFTYEFDILSVPCVLLQTLVMATQPTSSSKYMKVNQLQVLEMARSGGSTSLEGLSQGESGN